MGIPAKADGEKAQRAGRVGKLTKQVTVSLEENRCTRLKGDREKRKAATVTAPKLSEE